MRRTLYYYCFVHSFEVNLVARSSQLHITDCSLLHDMVTAFITDCAYHVSALLAAMLSAAF